MEPRVTYPDLQIHPGVRNAVLVDRHSRVSFAEIGKKKYPFGAILHYDAAIDAFSELTGGHHTFNHAVLSPQYQHNADGSYSNVGAKPAVDTFDGERWVRSCGAVTNLLPSGWPFSNTNIAVSTIDKYIKLEKITAISSSAVASGILPAGVLYTATITLRAGSGLTGTKFDFGYFNSGFKPIAVSSFSGPGTYVVTGGTLVRVSDLSETEDTTVSFTLTSILETQVAAYFYPCGTASKEVGASVLIKDFILTATSYPVPYVPPGVTQPASNATTTNGMWFSLPDGSELWHALDGGPETDGVELVVNGDFSDGLTGWVLHEDAQIVNGALRVNSDDVSQTSVVYASQTITALTVPATYRISFGVSQINAGMFSVVISGNPTKIIVDNITGVYSEVVTVAPGSSKSLIIYGRHSYMPRDFTIDNISIQRLQPQPLTLATRVRMGVGSGDMPDGVRAHIISARNGGSAMGDTLYSHNLSGTVSLSRSWDGQTAVPAVAVAWGRGAIACLFLQINTAGSQYRTGYMIEGTHTTIQWGTWTAYDGSFDPSTLYRLTLGNENPYPMWFNKITAWKKQATDAEILEAWT